MGMYNPLARQSQLYLALVAEKFREVSVTNMTESQTQMDIGLRFRGALPHDKCDFSYRVLVRIHDMYELRNWDKMTGQPRFFFEAEIETAPSEKYGEHRPMLKVRVFDPKELLQIAEDFWNMLGSPVE